MKTKGAPPFTPLHQYQFSPHYSLYIFRGIEMENLFRSRELLLLILLTTLTCDSGGKFKE